MSVNLSDTVKNIVDSCYDPVSRIAYPLFKNTPISFFTYERAYDSVEFLYLGTSPEVASHVIIENLFPTFAELNLFTTFGLRSTFLSINMPLPPGAAETNPEKYTRILDLSVETKLYHSLFITDRMSDHYRMCGFGVTGDLYSVFNFYMNVMPLLDNFITYFEHHGDELIERSCQNSLIMLPHYHKELVLNDPDIKLEIDFSALDFTIKPPATVSDYNQRFTQREHQCLSLVAQGYTMKNAAKKLLISPRTVEQHLRNIKDKNNIQTKNQLVDLWHYSQKNNILTR